MTALPTPDTTALHGVTRLNHLGVIQVEGDDAARFLHGQLTQDFALLGLSEARLAAFCSPKGRMQASFVGFKRSHEQILLVCSRDLLPATLKRLSMFVMRAKANPSDAAPPAGEPVGGGQWDWLDVRSAVATLTQPVFEAFVPQMLNYESVGGVNFKKGCYPGQEVVARSQFRGTLKRRAFLVHGHEALSAGQEIFHSSDAEQPCGTVVQAAAHPAEGFDAIVSMQTSAAADGSLHAGAPGGPLLTLLPLPYPLLDDI